MYGYIFKNKIEVNFGTTDGPKNVLRKKHKEASMKEI